MKRTANNVIEPSIQVIAYNKTVMLSTVINNPKIQPDILQKVIRPFVKWAGGKSQLLGDIRKRYPVNLGMSINKYAEPFVGGGAVLFDILSRYDLDEVYISDTNAELIHTYRVLRDNSDNLISSLLNLQNEYLPGNNDYRKKYFYEMRKRYNILKAEETLTIEVAALFIFLNRTCFNGLYRVNSKGEFNVPMGAYKNPLICNVENLKRVAESLNRTNVKIVHADYHKSNEFLDSNAFVYFDPPYRPLNGSSSFTQYTENSFNDDDQIKLAEYIIELSKRGVKVLVSNSDPKNTNPDDSFFDELYKGFKINRIPATRMINSNASSRGEINELLISNLGDKNE